MTGGCGVRERIVSPKLVRGCLEMMWLQGFDERRSEDGEFQRGVELGHGEKMARGRRRSLLQGIYLKFHCDPLATSCPPACAWNPCIADTCTLRIQPRIHHQGNLEGICSTVYCS